MLNDKSQTTDPDDYNPVGPIRTFHARVQFVNVGRMPPMNMEFPMTETTRPKAPTITLAAYRDMIEVVLSYVPVTQRDTARSAALAIGIGHQ